MTDLLFDAPWWLPAGIAVLGIVVFVIANRRTETKTRNIGLAIILLGAIVGAVSYLVDTPIEMAEKGSRRLVESFVARDWNVFRSLLDPSATVTVLEAGTIYRDRAAIMTGAQTARDQYGIDTANVTEVTAQRVGPLITTEIGVISQQNVFPYPLPTRWQLEWHNPSGQGWVIARVTCLRIGDTTGTQAAQQFPGR